MISREKVILHYPLRNTWFIGKETLMIICANQKLVQHQLNYLGDIFIETNDYPTNGEVNFIK